MNKFMRMLGRATQQSIVSAKTIKPSVKKFASESVKEFKVGRSQITRKG